MFLSGPHWADGDPADYLDCVDMAAVCEVPVRGSACNVAAIGRCADCERAFCGSHAALTGYGSSFTNLCSECPDRRERERMARSRVMREEAAEAERARLAALVPLERVADPVERILRARVRGQGAAVTPEQTRDIARWFAARATEQRLPQSTFRQYAKTFFGGTKVTYARGWAILSAYPTRDPDEKTLAGTCAYIREDGAFFAHDLGPEAGDPNQKLTWLALQTMAELLALD